MKLNNAITDVPGIEVGQVQDDEALTGCTVILCRKGAVAGVDVRGGAPGTRETDLLNPVNLVEKVHAVVLAGGSAFGLDAASGVMRYLEENDIGFNTGVAKVPIVPAAILFDLNVGSPDVRPDAEMGYRAASAASTDAPSEGDFGAGAGASVGKILGAKTAMKAGIGTASMQANGVVVGAIVAVNSWGDVVDPKNGEIIAGARSTNLGPLKIGSQGYFADTLEMMKTLSGADCCWGCDQDKYRHWCGCHQCQIDPGGSYQSSPDGAGWPGAHNPPGAHHVGRRYDFCAGDRREKSRPIYGRRVCCGGDGAGDSARGAKSSPGGWFAGV